MPNLMHSIVRRGLTDGGFAQAPYLPERMYERQRIFWTDPRSSHDMSKTTDVLLGSIASIASRFSLAEDVDKRSLFNQYMTKLRSYRSSLAPFLLTTLPPVLALVPIYVAFRLVQGMRRVTGVEHTFLTS